MVPEVRIELTTYPLPRGCATTTLLRLLVGRPAQKVGCYSPGAGERERAYGVAKSGKSAKRDERLAQALRENLKRRKARDRARAADPSPPPPIPANQASVQE